MKKRTGNLFVVSAPSGAGKTTLCQRLSIVVPGLMHSVSYTTRPPRPGEVNNRDYTFVDEEEFRKLIEEGEFAEWARVHGNLYGTSRRRLEVIREKGTDVILDIDTQGARHLRNSLGNGVYIFILPVSLAVLRERLESRKSNTPEDIRRRMLRAVGEIGEYKNYDYVIINDQFEDALEELRAIVLAERSRRERIDPEWMAQFTVEEA